MFHIPDSTDRRLPPVVSYPLTLGQVWRKLDHPNAHGTRQPVVLRNLRWSDDGAWLKTKPPWRVRPSAMRLSVGSPG
jgi:hypothetical protein